VPVKTLRYRLACERSTYSLVSQSGSARSVWLSRVGTFAFSSLLARYAAFYEKVVKVKADVAAIINIFLPLPSRRLRPIIGTRHRWVPSGGCARGVSAERFETPLAGGAAASMRAGASCWRAACQRRGGNPPAPAFPRRGKRKRGRSDFLAAAGDLRLRCADGRHAADLVCARSSPHASPDSDHQHLCRSSQSAIQKSCRRHPLLAVLLSALLMGRDWPGASWGPI
jgi:hypothetical protein